MSKSKKWTVLCLALVMLLALDAAITWKLAMHHVESTVQAEPAARMEAVDPLDQFRLEREQLRARQEAQLNDIVHGDKTDAQTVHQAQAQLMSLIERAEQELTLEGILQGRGFADAVVSVGERSCNVLLRQESVTQQESAVILELVMRETGLTGGNVKIIPVK